MGSEGRNADDIVVAGTVEKGGRVLMGVFLLAVRTMARRGSWR